MTAPDPTIRRCEVALWTDTARAIFERLVCDAEERKASREVEEWKPKDVEPDVTELRDGDVDLAATALRYASAFVLLRRGCLQEQRPP